MRVVLDTNVFVSALIESRGPSAMLVSAWLEDEFTVICSQAQLDEIRDVLARPRLRKWITIKEVEKLLDTLPAEAVMVEPAAGVRVSPDPDDDVILATAIGGHADLIVSGDKAHMLDLVEVEGIPIVTVREALRRLTGRSA